MKVDLIASEFWYRDHMLPIFECLPTRLQGHVFLSPQLPASHCSIMWRWWPDGRTW